MAEPDDPAFPPPPARGAHAYRAAAQAPAPMPGPPRATVVRRPDPPRADAAPVRRSDLPRATAAPVRSDSAPEPDLLARALGPGRMPRLIVRYPRLSGVGLMAIGALGATRIVHLSAEGGVYMRALPVVTAAALFLGAWLAVVGRPADARGYTPPWWNAGYVAILMGSVVVALATGL